jgi:sterol desaturase/sphingolipid hydroxylase (fatty acid hydroxylase superfamily)
MRFALVVGWFVILYWQEERHPLRRRVERRIPRLVRNGTVAGVTAAALHFVEPLITRLAHTVGQQCWGIAPRLPCPSWMRNTVALLLMDYTLYVWHVLTHRVPFLWRLHLVHHVDPDLDVSTAVRFHVTEMLVSVLWRAAQVVLIGVTPGCLKAWQTITMLSVAFHHSNLRLSPAVERVLVRWIVTPRMHGIHHSTVPEETNSNWSSGLTLWDWLHGTLRLNIPQGAITIGAAGYRDPDGMMALLMLPFNDAKDAEASHKNT